ncbi:MAG: hypothetical protein HDR10_02665 [Lachnospiraceae bacterium]|nr:hypothetical protein [Lachnospiraceae bacterium]
MLFPLQWDKIGKICGFKLSDAAFGDWLIRSLTEFDISDIRAGDILNTRNQDGTYHAAIILEVHDGCVVVAEGNYSGKVHWGHTTPPPGRLPTESNTAASTGTVIHGGVITHPKNLGIGSFLKSQFDFVFPANHHSSLMRTMLI